MGTEKPLFALVCINCGEKEYFTVGKGAERFPICEKCRKTRKQRDTRRLAERRVQRDN